MTRRVTAGKGGPMELTIGVAQLDLALGDPAANLASVRAAASQAASAGVDLLVLPELWGSGYDLERAGALSAALGEGLFAATADLARELKLAICGSLLEQQADGIYNTSTIYDAAGA